MIYASMPSPWRHLPQSRRPAPFDINPRQFRRHLFLALFRIRRHWGGAWLHGPPAERILMFPLALSALRPTECQRREHGATRCGPSGTFRPRNRISITLFACSLATQNTKGL